MKIWLTFEGVIRDLTVGNNQALTSRNWKDVTNAPNAMRDHGMPAIILSICDDLTKLTQIGTDTKARFSVKDQACYSFFKKECWERVVELFYDEDESFHVNQALSDKPEMLLFRQLFNGSWVWLRRLCTAKANETEERKENEATDTDE